MNVSANVTKDYDNKLDPTLGENKPNSNPISSEAKMSANVCFRRNYKNNSALRPPKNKPKTKPIPQKPKMSANFCLTKDYENKPSGGFRKTNPNKPKQACPARPERGRGERSRTGRMDPISMRVRINTNFFREKD